MATSIFTKFYKFVENLSKGVHNMDTAANNGHAFKVALSNAANPPSAALDEILTDLVQIAYTNLSARDLVVASCEEIDGSLKWIVNDLVLTASGAVAPFRYVIIYDDTPTSPIDPLIGFLDYGAEVTLANGETFTIDLDNVNGVLNLL